MCRLSRLKFLLLVVLVNVTVTGAMLWFYHTRFAPRVAVVNVDEFVREMASKVTSREVSIEEVRRRAEEFSRSLQEYVRRRPGSVVLLKEVVVAGDVEEIRP